LASLLRREPLGSPVAVRRSFALRPTTFWGITDIGANSAPAIIGPSALEPGDVVVFGYSSSDLQHDGICIGVKDGKQYIVNAYDFKSDGDNGPDNEYWGVTETPISWFTPLYKFYEGIRYSASTNTSPTTVPSPTTPNPLESLRWSAPVHVDSHPLMSVSCPMATFCLAADLYGDVLTYNGTTWSAPKISIGGSIDVSCTSRDFCAGLSLSGQGATFNGVTWSKAQSTGFVYSPQGGFPLVSCATTSFCVAVGPLGQVVTYNGGTWSAPKTVSQLEGYLPAAISCPSTTFCAVVASGSMAGGDVVLYNGATWSNSKEIDSDVFGPQIRAGDLSGPTEHFCAAVDTSGRVVVYQAGATAV
jgi:hypothetical protein